MTQEQWGQLKEELREAVGKNNYKNWIEPLHLTNVSNDVAVFRVPTNFIGNYVAQHYGDLILYKVTNLTPNVRRIEFQVAANSTDQPTAVLAETQGGEANEIAVHGKEYKLLESVLSSAPLDERFTFDRFVVGKPNELAHAAAKRVSEGGEVTFNPLFLYGGVGLGKTHLMHAIAWELRQRSPDLNVVYLSAEQFMYRFVQALRDKRMMDFKEMFRSVDVLMVDDVQFIAGKESTQEEFFHTFNALVDQHKQIVISADRAPGEIQNLEERIKSRLQCGLVVDLHPTDYELRLGVLQSKSDSFKVQYPNVVVAPGVLEFLAHRISTNVRVLEGALTRLYAFSSLVGHDVTLELAQDCLADVLRASERKVSIEEIQRQVAEHYNIRLSEMIG
ncbi:MAG: chromosomal replication initiator protein DnaA, partial [Pseudomonadota bacterium]